MFIWRCRWCGRNQIDKRNASGLADTLGHLDRETPVPVPDRMHLRPADTQDFGQIARSVNMMFPQQFTKCHGLSIQKFLFFATSPLTMNIRYCTLKQMYQI